VLKILSSGSHVGSNYIHEHFLNDHKNKRTQQGFSRTELLVPTVYLDENLQIAVRLENCLEFGYGNEMENRVFFHNFFIFYANLFPNDIGNAYQ